MNIITEEDYELIGAIMNISYSLLDNLYKLRNLELSNKKDTDEFKSLTESIKTTLDLEKSLYEKLGNNPDKINYIANNILDLKDAWSLGSELKIVSHDNQYDLVKFRIVLKLLFINNRENKNESVVLNGLTSISIEVRKDIVNSILSILNEYLNDKRFNSIKKELLTLKYNLAFLFEWLEKYLVENNFKINDEVYWSSYLVAETYNLDYSVIERFQYDAIVEISKLTAENIMLGSAHILYKSEYLKAVISQIYLRAMFLISDDDLRNAIKNKFMEFCNNINVYYIDKTRKFLLDTVSKYDEDKEKINILSLNQGLKL